MLDQNTDRMWYVIGAVIIGAAIIFILNGTMPELFASIGGTFEDKAKETTAIVDGIHSQQYTNGLLKEKQVHATSGVIKSYNARVNEWTITVNSKLPEHSVLVYGLGVRDGEFVVPYGQTARVSYDIFLPETVDALRASVDINNSPVSGELWNNGNDDDNKALRTYNGQLGLGHPTTMLQPGSWTTVTFSYTNSDPRNVNEVALQDRSYFGVYNDTGTSFDIKIRNVRVDVGE